MPGVALKQVSNLNVKRGDVLVDQGESANCLILLNQGKAIFQVNLNPEASNQAPKNICLMDSPAIVGASALLLQRPYPYSIVAASALTLTSVPSSEEAVLKFFSSKPGMAPLLLRSVSKETVDTFTKVNAVCTATINLARYITSLSLAYFKINPEIIPQAKNKRNDNVLQFALKVYHSFNKKGGEIPEEITMDFLKEDHLDPEQHQAHLHVNFDTEELNYYRRFTRLPPQILGAIATRDPKFVLITVQKLSDISFSLIRGLIESNQYLETKIDLLLNHDYGWVKKIAHLIQGKQNPKQMANWENMGGLLINLIKMAERQYQSVWEGSKLDDKVDKSQMRKVEDFVSSHASRKNPEKLAISGEAQIKINPKALEETKGMAKKIFQYANLSSKFSEYTEIMDKFKRLKNPLDTDSDVRKLRRGVNNLFWELYETAFIKYAKNNEQLPRYLQIFFNFSVLEETLLEPAQLGFLYTTKEMISSEKYVINTPIEWLKKIYEREVPTSINELGLTFFEIIRQNNRDKPWKRESDLPPEIDTPEARLKFEIQNMLAPTAKLTSGSVMTYSAPLSKFQINQPLEQSFSGKNKIEDALEKLLDVDFSCFHREILFEKEELGILREFIQTRIVPNIILTPTAGNIFQHWQEREGRDKISPGRVCAPFIVTDDVYKRLLSASGCYRWEMTKTLMGPDWNNISQSSITADYTDYVQFFKKNRELSPEMKEKISQEFKRFRDDRSRFVNDYIIWMMFESEGTQRLNKVARKIMAKHVPFRKPYREKLLKLPSYIDLINKNINIRRRKAREIEPRLKKYRQNNNDKIPRELVETFDFYNMEY